MRQGHPALVWIAYGVLVLMNIVDVVYTERALLIGLEEGNPLMAWAYQRYGIAGPLVAKGIFLTMFLFVIPTFSRYKVLERVFYLSVFIYTCLTFYHIWLYVNIVRGISEGFT